MRKRIFGLSLLVIVLILAGVIALNLQFFKDWYIVQTTDVQPAAAQLGDKLTLTSHADFLYEASQPEVLNAGQFNQACANVARERSIVLGCYTHDRVYIYNVSDPQLTGVQEVTAAHELLHAVYERMSSNERVDIDTELTRVAGTIQDQQFKDTIAEYQKTEPSEINNELHSILGTEYASLSPKLESHYAQYFNNRQQIVEYSTQYQSIFRQVEQQRQSYEQQRTLLYSQITELKTQLASLQVELDRKQAELQTLRSTDISAYNAAVPPYNTLVKTYNNTVTTLRSKIDEYNRIVDQENTLATTIDELNKKLDSNYQAK